MAEADNEAVGPGEARRRFPRWVAIALAVAVVVLAGLGIAALLADDDESPETQWEECARRVDPPADRSARLEEFSEADDEEAARQRLAEEIGRVEERIEAECGERP